MEKAVLKTLNYYDIFDFPLKAWEIHKWLIGRQASLKQVEKTLAILIKKEKISQPRLKKIKSSDYYCLKGRTSLIKERIQKEAISKKHLQVAKYISIIFKIIPWIKLVGISGSLAMMGSSKTDDIDLFVITSKKRIWVTRLMLILITSLTGLRRTRREKQLQVNGKICINLILEESNLAQNKKNIYLAHEVLQMKILWQRDGVYSLFLHANDWAFKFLPNWKSSVLEIRKEKKSTNSFAYKNGKNNLTSVMENFSKNLQLKIMGNPDNSERIEKGALYFHPEDKGVKILGEYKKRLNNLLS